VGYNYQCAIEFDAPGVINDRFVCLKECAVAQTPQNGMACETRETLTGTAQVWVPMTTCFAFDKFGEDCSVNVAICSVDGSGPILDGACPTGTCTFSCYDSGAGAGDGSWCPNNNCDIQYCAVP
jgi:hypothetical protein